MWTDHGPTGRPSETLGGGGAAQLLLVSLGVGNRETWRMTTETLNVMSVPSSVVRFNNRVTPAIVFDIKITWSFLFFCFHQYDHLDPLVTKTRPYA